MLDWLKNINKEHPEFWKEYLAKFSKKTHRYVILSTEATGDSIEKDVITYISEPLEEEMEIAGPIKLILFVSSSALDTDFCAKICDMRPNGESYNLQAGFIRMRYRESLHMPLLIEPGKIYRLEILLRSVAHAFFKNHRIQLQITSCDFPVHDRNLNTGKSSELSTEIEVAHQTLYTGGQYPSHLILPKLK